MKKTKRRDFLKKVSVGGLVLGGVSKNLHGSEIIEPKNKQEFKSKFSANDQIQVAIIGCGIQGMYNAKAAETVRGVKVTAGCDLYTGRLESMKERHGDGIFTTRDYREILSRSDIDAVCIATSDHWHDHITIAALEAGKAVYCEKPMVHHLHEGHAVIEAEKKYKRPLQIGSQRVSSIVTAKAKELYEQGVIGELNLADVRNDRSSATGAWQYSIPTDASAEAVSWDDYLGDAPKLPFDAKRFFRWRNYRDYGTGVAGDLFVHLFSGLHVITGSIGPERIFATGGLRFWKDGRDVPDITLGVYDYPKASSHPAFNVQMRVNFADGSGGGSHIRLIGTEGMMTVTGRGLVIEKTGIETMPEYRYYDSYATFSKSQKEDYKKWHETHYGHVRPKMSSPGSFEYKAPEGYDSHSDHWWFFADAIRNDTKLVEDGEFGLRAAGPSLATNNSYFERKVIDWDAKNMKIV